MGSMIRVPGYSERPDGYKQMQVSKENYQAIMRMEQRIVKEIIRIVSDFLHVPVTHEMPKDQRDRILEIALIKALPNDELGAFVIYKAGKPVAMVTYPRVDEENGRIFIQSRTVPPGAVPELTVPRGTGTGG